MQRSLFISSLGLAASALIIGSVGAQNLRTPTQVSPAGAFDAAIASVGDISCVCWVEGNTLYSSVSDGTGKTWSAPVQVVTDTANRKDMRGDDVVIVDDTIYVHWIQRTAGAGGDREPNIAYSTDNGANWTELGPNVGGLATPVTRGWRFLATAGATSAQNDDNLWSVVSAEVGAGDEELYVISSTDGGGSFAANFAQPGTTEGGNANDVDGMSAAAAGSTLYLAWNDERSGASPIADDTWYNSTTDGGATWQYASGHNVEADAVADAESTSIAVSGSTVAVAWTQQRFNSGSNEEILCAISTDGGANFGTPLFVGGYARESSAGAGDGNDVDGFNCSISANGDVIVAYSDNRNGANEISASVSSGGGAFVEVAGIATGSFPTLVSGDYDVMVFDTDSNPEDLVHAISYDNGASWDVVTEVTAGDVDIPGDNGDSMTPNGALAINNFYDGNVLVAWLDDGLGGNEAFVSGYRGATVTPEGWDDALNPLETNLQWHFKGFQDKGAVFIALSIATGPSVSDGRTICLDAGWPTTFTTSTLFFTGLTAGAGSTPPTANFFPTLFPSGLIGIPLKLNYAGVGVAGPGGPFIFSETASMTL